MNQFARPRPSPAEMAARRENIRESLATGMKASDIANQLNCSARSVYDIVKNDETMTLNNASDPVRKCGTLGALRPSLERQDRKFLAWLAGNKIEGVTVADFLISCAVDAYLEETETAALAA